MRLTILLTNSKQTRGSLGRQEQWPLLFASYSDLFLQRQFVEGGLWCYVMTLLQVTNLQRQVLSPGLLVWPPCSSLHTDTRPSRPSERA